MDVTSFEQLLKDAIGLDVASIGSSAVERAVRERQRASGLTDLSAYWDHLRSDNEELQQLIDAVVVPETWFFRDRGAFSALTGAALPEWLRTHARGVFRLLSIPCATGEEPYSLAMALLDAGLPPERFRIDAFDVSARALETARRAVYGKRSFRGGDLEFRDRHFQPTAGGFELDAPARAGVRFHQRNLLTPSLVDQADRYDVIFCRNLLIYFDRPTQDQAIGVLGRLLTPDGMLFVGPSETGVLLAHDFRSASIPMAFAFRPGARDPRRPQSTSSRPASAAPRPRHTPRAARPARMPFASAPAARAGAAVVSAQPTGSAALQAAQRLADEGRLAEAVERCEEHVRRHGPTAPAYYLLGLVHDAGGDPAAAEACYRKTLYLDPAHDGALAHLAAMMDTQGRAADAQRLRRRVGRRSDKKST